MKTNLFRTCAVAVLAAAAALSQQPIMLKADVPVDFVAGGKTLPAGRYTVERATITGSLMVRSADSKTSAMFNTQAIASNFAGRMGKLVFHRYGRTYFLSEIWTPGEDMRKVPTTYRERQLNARMAAAANLSVAAVR